MVTLCARVGWPDSLTGMLGAAVIKAAQPSRIYHVGIYLPDDGYLYQSRMRQGVHREPWDVFADPDWIQIPCPWRHPDDVRAYFRARVGNHYDTLGLIDWGVRRLWLTLMGEEIRPGIEDQRREMCSEFAAGALGFDQPIRWSPSAVARECRKRSEEYSK